MKPTELRIGNLVMWEDESHDIVEVVGITHIEGLGWALDFRERGDMGCSGSVQFDEFTGIPITPEWLERFGFKQWKDFTGDIEYSLEVPNDYGGSIIGSNYKGEFKVLLVGCDEGRVGNFIDYVHQLQNLTFALTGEELTIKQ